MRHDLLLIRALLLPFVFVLCSSAAANEGDFSAWLTLLKTEAEQRGISGETLGMAFAEVKAPRPKVIRSDRKQPEFTQTLDRYLASRINNRRISNGNKMLRRYPTWLGRVERTYGVQRRFIVALWGIESSYGERTGNYPVIESLATLAYDGRRSDYFRQELFEALRLIDDRTIPLKRMRGSWAGAMGQCQFMPSSYRLYGVDEDRSGTTNLWGSVPDVLGSTANFLSRRGWQDDQTWGREVRLPQGFDLSLVGLKRDYPLSRWQELGVRRSNGRDLPLRNLSASLIMPDGPGGPAYLVYDNFRIILSWNRSLRFAITVGTLSDQYETGADPGH